MLLLRAARRAPHLARTFRASAPALGKSLKAPFISDTVPLPEGILGTVEELHIGVGDVVNELDVIGVVETDKVSLDIKATASGTVTEVLVEVGEEIKELQELFRLE